jgi:polyhydroxybutyrate depolymerase
MRPAHAALAVATLAACGRQPHWPETADATPSDACAAGAYPDEAMVLQLAHGGRTRRALVWAPPTAGPHDVVVNLHEYRSDPERQAHYSRWVPLARRVNAILVAPDGRAATWNAGGCCGKAAEEGTDDVAFLDAVVAAVEAHGCTSGRVLATGIGNGGMMAEHWAWLSNVPDAVISVGGALQNVPLPDAARPVPVLHYHGENDAFLPADGSLGKALKITRPIADATAAWVSRNGAAPVLSEDDAAMRCARWEGRAPVVSCTVLGMADQWPGGDDAPTPTAHRLARAADDGWAWFQQVAGPQATNL